MNTLEPGFNRGKQISLKDDKVINFNISLSDHDNAILWYIENKINPTVEINGNQTKIPIIYGSPERWKSMQKDGFYRDKNGKDQIPLIMVKRESFEKDRRMGNKLDGNTISNVQYFKVGYSKRNSYDNFNRLNNQIPAEEYRVGIIPDYIILTYRIMVFTDYIEHMNSITEGIEFASDSYWGDKEKFQFRASIDSFPTSTAISSGDDRAIMSELNLKVNGYIIPKNINSFIASPVSREFNKTKIIFKESII